MHVVALPCLNVCQVTEELELRLWTFNMDVGCFLIWFYLFEGSTQEIRELILEEIRLHENVAMTFRHHVQALIRLSDDRAYWPLLYDILQSHAMENTEGKLNTELESLIGISILHGTIQDSWCITKEVRVIF